MADVIRRQKGSGLIDMVIAIVLLGVVLVAYLNGFRYISMGTRDNTQRVQALMLAQEIMEKYKNDYDGIKAAQFPNLIPIQSPVDCNGVKYTLSVTLPHRTVTNLQPFQLTVRWYESGAKRNLRMVEYIYLTQ